MPDATDSEPPDPLCDAGDELPIEGADTPALGRAPCADLPPIDDRLLPDGPDTDGTDGVGRPGALTVGVGTGAGLGTVTVGTVGVETVGVGSDGVETVGTVKARLA